METRFNGTLKKWNAERGFGFVVAEAGDQELFVHVSAFPRDGRTPAVGERLTFEMEQDKEGRKRAVRVRRSGAAGGLLPRHAGEQARHQNRREPHRTEARSFSARFVVKSKGLEFPVVALPGVGHMPANGEDEKEAARVFYVAATRATQELMIGAGGDGSFRRRLT